MHGTCVELVLRAQLFIEPPQSTALGNFPGTLSPWGHCTTSPREPSIVPAGPRQAYALHCHRAGVEPARLHTIPSVGKAVTGRRGPCAHVEGFIRPPGWFRQRRRWFG